MPPTALNDDGVFRNYDVDVDVDVEAADQSMSSNDGLTGFHSQDPRRSQHRRSRVLLFVTLFALICPVLVLVVVETSRRSSRL
mmetsp:Transcript_31292/g.91653  ORF Transcript_31292/g.91653 Transcript_31292/m.91653 type:complete len:83 (-) Transcript_31292:2451-2699(-)